MVLYLRVRLLCRQHYGGKRIVAVNGVSLTVVNSQPDSFQVAIIPYTHEHTNFHTFRVGTTVNLEFDIVGKYITKLMQLYRVK